METMKLIIEMKYQEGLAKIALSGVPTAKKELCMDAVPSVKGVNFDISFPPVKLPGLTARTAMNVPLSRELSLICH